MGMGMIPPQVLAQFAAMIQNQQPSGGGGQNASGQPQGAPAMPTVQPGMPGASPSPNATLEGGGPQIPRLGGNNMRLPSGVASPTIPGVGVSAQPPKQPTQTRASGIAALPFAVMGIKQKMNQDKVQKYRALTNAWIAKQQNPDIEKAMQQRAKANPDVAKALEKEQKEFVKMVDEAMKNPDSPAGQGIQQAYRDQKMQDVQEEKFQQMQTQMQAMQALEQQRQALAERERAQAEKERKATGQMGTVTEKDRFAAQQKAQLQTNALNAKMNQMRLQSSTIISTTQNRLQSAERQTHERVEGGKEQARIRAEATIGAARMRAAAAKQNDFIVSRYRIINQQATELDRQQKALQDHIDKTTHLGGLWEPDDLQDVQSQIAQIEAQRQFLQGQLQQLQSEDQFYQSKGIIPTPVTSGATDQPNAPQSGGKPSAGVVIHKMY
jgi:hypothetical protein